VNNGAPASCCKYLKKRAITSPWQLSGNAKDHFRAAVVIPALAEAAPLADTLANLERNASDFLVQTLVVVVVNNRADASCADREENRQTLEWLERGLFSQLNLVWVNAVSPGFELPAGEGVGLARKIGFDLVLTRLDWSCAPLLISLDADTRVDDHYLAAIFRHFEQRKSGGAVLAFRHQSGETPQQETAIRNYELYLRSYLFGLHVATSPYAYHAIGSAFACRATAYIAAGGMNRRRAAEDFYFLQQLKKTSGIAFVSGTTVCPSSRFSHRVPFGTGKVVQEQVEEGSHSFQFISVTGFRILKEWLELIDRQLSHSSSQIMESVLSLSPLLHDFLQELNFPRVWQKLQRNHPTSG